MAHEMGHYVLNHGAKITMALAIFIFVGFGLAAAIFNRAIKKRGPSWGVNGIADPAGFPLLITPIRYTFSAGWASAASGTDRKPQASIRASTRNFMGALPSFGG
jgi:Zn-dependent protease with chaperone function